MKEIGIAAGVYEPSPEQLLAIRTWLAAHHAPFRKLARGPEKLMGKLGGESLVRPPKGFAIDHPALDLIKMKRWIYHTALDPKLATSPKILSEIVRRFKVLLPVMEELNKPLAAKKQAASFL